jgi:hypothetical protein
VKADRSAQRERFSGVSVSVLAGLGVYLFGFAWPLGAYQRIYGGLHLHHLALVPIFLAALLDMKQHKRLRVPFELWWPCALILVLVGLLRAMGHTEISWRVAGACVLFVAVAHSVRNRRTALRALQFTVMSGSVMLLLSALARFELVYPTTYDLESGLVMAGPYSVREGVAIAVCCLLLLPALVAAARNGEFTPCRIGVAAWFLLPVAAVLYGYPAPHSDLRLFQPWHGLFLLPTALLAALFLWGVARIGAKLLVARKFMAPGVYYWLMGALLAGVLSTLALAPPLLSGFVFLLAIIAGYAQPYVASKTTTRPVAALVVLTGVVVTINITMILPGDPRNYEQFARNALARGDVEALPDHLAFVQGIAPGETRAAYYSARAWLARNQLIAAVQSFRASLKPGATRLLPPPDETLIAEFLNEMRDRSSALPERVRGVAYEQALMAAGRERHALSLLELRGESGDHPETETRSLAAALATVLDAPHLTDTLRQWEGGLLTDILLSAGTHNEIAAVPQGFPQELLPMVVLAQPGFDRDRFHVFSPAGQTGAVRRADAKTPGFTDMALVLGDPGWGEWRQNAAGIWALSFGMIAEVHILNAPHLLLRSYPTQWEDYTEGGWEIRIFLPNRE